MQGWDESRTRARPMRTAFEKKGASSKLPRGFEMDFKGSAGTFAWLLSAIEIRRRYLISR